MRRVVAIAAGVVVFCALAGSAVARAEPVATDAQAAEVAGFALKSLGNYLASQDNGFGHFLLSIGVGDATGPKLDRIQATLDGINVKLDALKDSVDQIRVAVEKARCEGIQNSLRRTGSGITSAWRAFAETLSSAKGADKPTQMALATDLKRTIPDDTGGNPAVAVREIHDALVGTGGSPRMIDVCGVAFQQSAGDFVTSTLNEQVLAMVGYWEGLEAKAAVLNVGLLVAADKTTPAKNANEDAMRNFRDESVKIKPSLGAMVYQSSSHLLWRRHFSAPLTGDQAISVPSYLTLLGAWKLPAIGQLNALAKDCCGGEQDAIDWFRNKTPFDVTPGKATTELVSSTNWEDLEHFYWAYNLGPGGAHPDNYVYDASCYATYVTDTGSEAYIYSS